MTSLATTHEVGLEEVELAVRPRTGLADWLARLAVTH